MDPFRTTREPQYCTLQIRNMKRTPLYTAHQQLGGKLIEFGGWEMPVQYTSIVDEHLAVRQAAGLFDISHMGEVRLQGTGAEAFLNRVLTNDIRKLAPGQGQYTLMCNEQGGVIDDLYAYRLGPQEYLLIINASRIDDDVAWLQKQHAALHSSAEFQLQNASDATGAIAVQGPRVVEFIDQCFPGASTAGTSVTKASELKKNQIARFKCKDMEVWVSRTGYTGEDGFEVVAAAERILEVWNHVLAMGRPFALKPAGLGARDTLRTEVCYPLYGHELDERTTPLEAGLGFFVALDKGEFIGRSILAEQKAKGTTKKLVAFKLPPKAPPPRPHYAIFNAGPQPERVGEVVSGTQSPSLGVGVGMGYVPPALAKRETPLQIEIRGKLAPAQVVAKPIYRKPE